MIQCHKNPKQINCLLNAMKNDSVNFFIHIDKKSNILESLVRRSDIHVLSQNERVNVQWGTFSQVQATLNLLNNAISNCEYDYYFLISGQDFPIQPVEKLLELLQNNKNANYINLLPSRNNGLPKQNNYDKRNQIVFNDWILKKNSFNHIIRRLYIALTGGYSRTFKFFERKEQLNLRSYFGSSWWCLDNNFIRHLRENLKQNPQYVEFFKKACCPDESFFQTAFMSSPFADTRKEYLHYIDWSEGGSSPKNLNTADLPAILKSGKFMARKIDGDFELINKLKENLTRN